MRTIALFSALALGAMTSVALAAAPTDRTGRLELSDPQMDGVKGGAPCTSNTNNPHCVTVTTNPGGQQHGCSNNPQCTQQTTFHKGKPG